MPCSFYGFNEHLAAFRAVFFYDDRGQLRSLPLGWTSAEPEDPIRILLHDVRSRGVTSVSICPCGILRMTTG
jgi:hypothetical protein